MNQQILDFFKVNLDESEVAGKKVIELGSRYVNGSVRPDIESKHPASYIGVDMEPGRFVDVVCPVKDIFTKFEPESFDIVVSCEMLEHVLDFREAINTIKDLARPGALILISSRSKGFGYHGYPYDFWRYEIDDMKNLFADCEIISLTSDGANGVILKARKLPGEKKDITSSELYNIIYDKRMRCEPETLEDFVSAAGGNQTKRNFFEPYSKLLGIGQETGTDKVQHGYLSKYEFFLKQFRQEKFNLLELGVFRGSSIKMWEQYFEHAQIYGCDINATTYAHNHGRVHIQILDLGNIASYPQLTIRTYRVIIDDASHYLDQQLLAFFYLFPYVEAGGIYILEDLHTNFPPLLEKFIHGSNDTAANVLLHLAELALNQNATPHDINGYHNILKSFAPAIDCISFIGKSCIIIKR